MLAAGQGVAHLTAIIDYNKWQATGRSQEIMALEPLGSNGKPLAGILKKLTDMM